MIGPHTLHMQRPRAPADSLPMARRTCLWRRIATGALALWVAALMGLPATADSSLSVFASAHYHIHTDLSRRQTVPFGRHMDLLFDQYERRFRRLRDQNAAEPDSGNPVYLLSTEQRYHSFLHQLGIAAQNSGGMFFVTREHHGVATWADGRNRATTRRTLQHEGFHQFAFDHFGRRLPPWMNEGLAQYFEDAVLLERGFELGLADPDRITLIRTALGDGSALPLASLFQLRGSDWHQTLTTDESRAGLLYAQAWSLVYYLIHGEHGAYQPAFESYLGLLGEGLEHDDAFTRAFGKNAKQKIESGWKRFAAKQLPDAVTVAAGRLAFLAEALAYKASRRESLPRDLDKLQVDLRTRGFAITRTVQQLQLTYSADQPELFTYTRPGGQVSRFELLEPSGYGLPPRITAPGLTPEPNIIWQRDGSGDLTYDIVYR